MDNFMYNVVSNGIGGVHCGGVEGDVRYRDSQDTLIRDVKIADFLKRTDIVQKAIQDGYLEPIYKYSSGHRDSMSSLTSNNQIEVGSLKSVIRMKKIDFMKKHHVKMKPTLKNFDMLRNKYLDGDIEDVNLEGIVVEIRRISDKISKIPVFSYNSINKILDYKLTQLAKNTYSTMFEVDLPKKYIEVKDEN